MKNQQILTLKAGEKVIIKAHATLDVEGWDKDTLSIETDLNVQRIQREPEGLLLLFVDHAALKVPENARILVERASGNARIRNVKGRLEINSVSGNLAVEQAGEVTVNRVSGSCLVREITGSLCINGISGNLKGKGCYAGVQVDHVSAGVELLDLHAGAEVRANGDIRLGFSSESLEPVKLRSSADISINLPFELDAEIQVKSNAHLTELVLGERKETIHHRRHTLLVGDGRRKFELEAGGKVRIVAEKIQDSDIQKLFEELDVLWGELRTENLARREAQAGKPDEGSAVDEGIDVPLEEMKKAEQRVQMALRQVENRLQSMGYPPLPESAPEGDASSGAARDLTGERLIIMKLLGENKISLAEADKLLEALEQY